MKRELNKKGLKATPQRIEIIKFLSSTKSHPSAEDVYKFIKEKFPTISFATVYNTLITLKNTGDIKELSIDPERKRFDMDLTPHDHFFCRKCKRVYDIYDLLRGYKIKIEEIDEHQVEEISLYYTGVCRDCKNKIGKEVTKI